MCWCVLCCVVLSCVLRRQGHNGDSPQTCAIDPGRPKRRRFRQFTPWASFLKRSCVSVGVYSWYIVSIPIQWILSDAYRLRFGQMFPRWFHWILEYKLNAHMKKLYTYTQKIMTGLCLLLRWGRSHKIHDFSIHYAATGAIELTTSLDYLSVLLSRIISNCTIHQCPWIVLCCVMSCRVVLCHVLLRSATAGS